MKVSVGILVFLLFVFAAPAVMAQQDCSTCSPQQDCSTACTRCADLIEHIDTCENYEYTTCGEVGYSCAQTQCTPDYQEISRVVQGTYGEGYAFFCEHHSMEWVTQVDVNCGSGYNYYCHDDFDGWKIGTSSQDCCDGMGPDGQANSGFLCNHYHACTG